MKKLKTNNCFVCGQDNPAGLHIDIEDGERFSKAQWIVPQNYVGYDNVLHGGIMAAILDDMMAHATYSLGLDTLTVHIEMDYRSPSYVGDKLTLEGFLIERGEGRSIKVGGRILRGETLIAEGTGVMVIAEN